MLEGHPAHVEFQFENWQAAVAELDSSQEGLTLDEVQARLQRWGKNELPRVRQRSMLVRFLTNFTHLMAILLWVGGAIAWFAQMPQLAVAVWSVNLINGVFSFWQEYKANVAVESLRRLLPVYALVQRGGTEQRIAAEELVPGDVMILAEGDRISADGILLPESDLNADESALTGESRVVHKYCGAFEKKKGRFARPDYVFAGTSITNGRGRAILTKTGARTEFGRIAHLTQSLTGHPSPLQLEMNHITRTVSVLAVMVGAVLLVAGHFLAGIAWSDSFIFALGMIVAFVPEGLLPTVTLSLAMGVQRMSRRRALVKQLSAVETLGCTTVICTDKTGTLTENQMTVRSAWMLEARAEFSGEGYDPQSEVHAEGGVDAHDQIKDMLVIGALCNNSRLLPPSAEEPGWHVTGDPTEAALLVAARKSGLDLKAAIRDAPRRREFAFDPQLRLMTTIHAIDHSSVVFTKGAPKDILARCTHIHARESDQPLTEEIRQGVLAANDQYALRGLRVLALAKRKFPESVHPLPRQDFEKEMVLWGLVAMHDPPRPDVAEAAAKCHRAGIRIIMITGDYELTAKSIAHSIGIVKTPAPRVINGTELLSLDDATLREVLRGEVIFARMVPDQKLRIVQLLQSMGEVVAVTGDGVNDAPALKQADIGIAMGVSGTEVAKEAADMVLTDDHFASIVNAVEEGRAVYDNIRRFVTYIVSSNMPEAVPFGVLLFSRGTVPLALTIMQVLSIDLGTDMVPAIGLGTEPAEPGVMDRPPRSRTERLARPALLAKALLWYGGIEAAFAMAAYFFSNWLNGWPAIPLAREGIRYREATTITLAAVVMTQIGLVLACRATHGSIFRLSLFSNRLVLAGIATELVLLVLLMHLPPLQQVFHTAPLGFREWLFVAAGAPILIALDEIRKAFLNRRQNLNQT